MAQKLRDNEWLRRLVAVGFGHPAGCGLGGWLAGSNRLAGCPGRVLRGGHHIRPSN